MGAYKNYSGYKFFGLQAGNYSFRIRAISAGGKSNWTKERYFFVPEQGSRNLYFFQFKINDLIRSFNFK